MLLRAGPGIGERCDGDSDEDEEEEEESSSSRSVSEDTTKRRRRKSQVRRRIGGARERELYGRLETADVECQDGLVCVEVAEDRMECQQENQDGNNQAEHSCLLLSLLSCTPQVLV